MSKERMRVQVCVIGAGTAGSAVARFAAEAGLSVLCIDQRPEERAGAHWVNGVPLWTWEAVGLERPAYPELRGHSERFHLVAGMEGPRIAVEGHQNQEVDMRLLWTRLKDGAERAGAVFQFERAVHEVKDAEVHVDRGVVEADWIVDASGLGGSNLLGNPKLHRSDICAAAQEVRVCDERAARAFIEAHGGREHEAVCFSGVAGGYSILNLHVEGDRINILTGSVPGDGHPSGRKMLDDFVAAHDWIGAKEFGGAAAIPIRRPFDTIARGRIAAVGDAACQVFPAHGSGITPQLLAARILVDNLIGGRGVEGYARDYQREWGGLAAGYDVFRKFSQSLPLEELAGLMEAGIMTAETSRTAIEQRLPAVPSAEELKDYAQALAKRPRLASRLLRVAAAMLAVRQLYRLYPGPGPMRTAWSRSVARLVGS